MPTSSSITTEQMRLVLEVSRQLTVTADLDLLLRRMAEAATSLLGAERASIFVHDREKRELWTKIALGSGEIRVPDYAGIVGHVFQTDELLNIPDAYADSRFNKEIDRKSGYVTRNLLTTPMSDFDGKPIGVMQVVNKIGGSFLSQDEAMLHLLADQAGVALQRYRLQQAAIETVELKREMVLARKVQDHLIPKNPPAIPGLEAVGWTSPASITGGDCFDLWRMTDGELGVFLGDASGHGLAPALVVSQARTLIRALSEIDCNPMWLLSRVNTRLASDLEDSRFVTAFAGCLRPDGLLKWYSAGHGPVFVRPDPDGPIVTLMPQAPPIGIDPDMPEEEPSTVQLEPGGWLIVLSDGIFEAMTADEAHELYGVDRLTDLLDRCRNDSPSDTLACIRDAMVKWQGREEPADDQTVVIIRRTK
jgi:sigma-B regulation protein RsbU (phosphoserine phosphatase)